MIKTTTWKPDTCDCVVEYDWDTDTTEDNRIHSHKRMVSICDDHKGIANPKHVFFHLLKENRSASATLHGLLQIARLTRQINNPDGSVITELLPNVESRRTFSGTDGNRRIKHQLIGANLTPAERLAFRQAAINFYRAVVRKDLSLADAAEMQSTLDINTPPVDID